MLRVTYVWHSCFVVELDKSILVFDYFPKEAVETVHFEGKMPELDANKHIYVFASHSHKDHFFSGGLALAGKISADQLYFFQGYPLGTSISFTQWT